MRIIRRFLCAPRGVTVDVFSVIGLALYLENPRWNAGVCDAILVEVEDYFFALLDFSFHLIRFTIVFGYLTVVSTVAGVYLLGNSILTCFGVKYAILPSFNSR